jgi:hypothetical protein
MGKQETYGNTHRNRPGRQPWGALTQGRTHRREAMRGKASCHQSTGVVMHCGRQESLHVNCHVAWGWHCHAKCEQWLCDEFTVEIHSV